MKATLDFIVIGAQKCGTTSLFEYLRQHPDVFIPPGKEWGYFSNDAHFFNRNWTAYLGELFAAADPAARWGTVTPTYMAGGVPHNPAPRVGDTPSEELIPLRLRERLPKVRLVALLRDPVARAWSHYRMAVLQGHEHRSFEQAITSALEPSALQTARQRPDEDTGYVVWSEYGRILEPYAELFSRDQLLVLFTEDLDRSPSDVMRRIYEFIQVDPNVANPNLDARYLVGASRPRFALLGKDSSLSPWGLQRAVAQIQTARRIWHTLPGHRRYQIERAFNRVTYPLDLWNRRPDVHDPPHDVAGRLREHFAPDTARLVASFDISPPWSTHCVTA